MRPGRRKRKRRALESKRAQAGWSWAAHAYIRDWLGRCDGEPIPDWVTTAEPIARAFRWRWGEHVTPSVRVR